MKTTRLDRARAVTRAAAFFALTLTGCASSSVDSQNSSHDSQQQGASITSLDAAITGSQRSDKARARDVYRHPKETLLFFDLGPTQAVLEIAPGGGWYTRVVNFRSTVLTL